MTYLSAHFRADRTAGACDKDASTGDESLNRIIVELHDLASEQVVNVHRTNLRNRYATVNQVGNAWKRLELQLGSAAQIDNFLKLLARG